MRYSVLLIAAWAAMVLLVNRARAAEPEVTPSCLEAWGER